MFSDSKRERCGIAWKWKFLCWANEECCELVPSTCTETKFGAFGLKPSSQEACCKMSDIFPWCVMEADLYELKLCRFNFYARSTVLLVFRAEWLAIFFPQACRPAFCSALGKNLPMWFLPSGDSLYQPFGFSRQPL